MTSIQILELVGAAVLAGLGVWLYRKPSPAPDQYGSQGAVLLFAVAAILLVHVVITVRAQPGEASIEVVGP